MKKYSSFICLFLLTSCGSLLPDRAFIAEMNDPRGPLFRAGEDFPVMKGDSGRSLETKTTERRLSSVQTLQDKRSQQDELMDREQALQENNPQSFARYLQDKKYLKTTADKLYYLSLGQEGRDYFINSRTGESGKDLIERHSVHYVQLRRGMSKLDLLTLLGNPNKKEYAGRRENQNEKWVYFEDGRAHIVYLEKGLVDGWNLDL